jgi:hypothetical protein
METIVNPSVNSNDVIFQLTEEISLRKQYTGAQLLWYYMAVNSFKDFGAKISTVARSVISSSRQNLKGTVTGLTATAGFNDDLTQHDLERIMPGFFYNDAVTRTFAANYPDIGEFDLSGMPAANPYATAGSFGATTPLADGYYASGTLLAFRGWGNSANNGLKVATGATAGGLTPVSPATVAEISAPSSILRQAVRVVGFQFAAGDLALTISGNDIVLTSTAAAWAHVNPQVGEWLYIGGDATVTQYATNKPFFGRVNYVDPAHAFVSMDMSTGVQVADNGAAKTVQVFGGTAFVNGSKRRSYTMTRIFPDYHETDGTNVTDYSNAEHVIGAVPNGMTLNVKQKSKLDVDLDWVAMDSLQDGKGVTSGVPYTTGTFINEVEEDPYNTSQSIYMMRLSILDNTVINPVPYFAYATDVKLDIKNNVTPNEAIGIVGAFDASVGTFEVSASITAYFASVHAIAAMRNNASVGLQLIGAMENYGFVFDLPLMTIGGGMPTVDKDKPVTMDLTCNGAKNAHGYTLAAYFFDYLPTVAMPK